MNIYRRIARTTARQDRQKRLAERIASQEKGRYCPLCGELLIDWSGDCSTYGCPYKQHEIKL